MTGFALLDVAIGVIFVILAFSLIASALQEALASFLNWRGRVLRRGLFRLLEGSVEHGQTLVNVTWLTPKRVSRAELTLKVLKDPALRSLYGPQNAFGRIWDWVIARVWTSVEKPLEDLGRLPSSIPRQSFSRALIDALARDAKQAYGELQLADGVQAAELPAALAATRGLLADWAARIDASMVGIAETVDGLPMDRELKDRLLRTLREVSLSRELQARLGQIEGAAAEVRTELEARIDQAQAVIDATVLELGDWFDATMDRVTGWYVRRVKWVLFALGALMAFGMNFDLIAYGGQLINSESLRNQIVARAELAVAEGRVGSFAVDDDRAALRMLALKIGSTVGENGQRQVIEGNLRSYRPSQDDLRLLGLEPQALQDGVLGEDHLAAVTAKLNAAANDRKVDTDNDGVISPVEAEAAIDATLERVRSVVNLSRDTLADELGTEDIPMGWRCDGRPVLDCVTDEGVWFPTGLASWLLIGLGCTLGGQFWFDLLRQVVRVKTAASGLNSDLKQATGATGAQAQGSAAARQAG